MSAFLKIPAPRTPDGTRKLGLAVGAQFRAERWAGYRRVATAIALLAGGLVVADTTFGFLNASVRHVCLAGWWTGFAAAVFAAVVEIWSTARLYRIVEEMNDEAHASPGPR